MTEQPGVEHPASSDQHPSRPNVVQRVDLSGRVQYVIAFAGAVLLTTLYLQPWQYPSDYVFTTGNDWLWQQAVFQMHADGGPWGAAGNLSWPIGANPWRLPQFSATAGIFGWVTVGWFGMGTAAATLWFLVFAAGLDAAAIVFLLRRLGGARQPVMSVAMAIALSASVFLVTHQINLALFAVVPVVFGVLVACTATGGRPSAGTLVFIGVLGFMSPLWWVVVLVLAVPLVTLPFVARRRWVDVSSVALVWLALGVGMGAQAVLHLVARSHGPGFDTTRRAWTSNDFHGHFSDLLVGSPLLRWFAPGAAGRIAEGSTSDLDFGLPILMGAAIAVVVLLVSPPRRSRSGTDTTVLTAATTVMLLFWLGGGLGNLQAAIAVSIDTVSPARIWYRMIVPLAVLGAGWVVVMLDRPSSGVAHPSGRSGSRVAVVSAALIVGLGAADLVAVDRDGRHYSRPDAEQLDHAAISFLRKATEPCAVAQLPHEAMPSGLITTDIIGTRLYRGLIPYVIAPEYRWTAGSLDPAAPDDRDLVADVSTEVTEVDFTNLAARGFCAVLYDRQLGELAIEQGVPLAGRSTSVTDRPDYEDTRYRLYLLDPP